MGGEEDSLPARSLLSFELSIVMPVGFELCQVFKQLPLLTRKIYWRDYIHANKEISTSAPAKHGNAFAFYPERGAALSSFRNSQVLFTIERRHGDLCSQRSLSE